MKMISNNNNNHSKIRPLLINMANNFRTVSPGKGIHIFVSHCKCRLPLSTSRFKVLCCLVPHLLKKATCIVLIEILKFYCWLRWEYEMVLILHSLQSHNLDLEFRKIDNTLKRIVSSSSFLQVIELWSNWINSWAWTYPRIWQHRCL